MDTSIGRSSCAGLGFDAAAAESVAAAYEGLIHPRVRVFAPTRVLDPECLGLALSRVVSPQWRDRLERFLIETSSQGNILGPVGCLRASDEAARRCRSHEDLA